MLARCGFLATSTNMENLSRTRTQRVRVGKRDLDLIYEAINRARAYLGLPRLSKPDILAWTPSELALSLRDAREVLNKVELST